MPQETVFVGVDVAKETLEIGELGARSWQAENGPRGWKKLIGWVRRQDRPVLVGVEPSGGYERGLLRALRQADVEVRWCDPARVRALAKALGAPAKTDAIDVGMIARFLAETGGRPVQADDERDALKAALFARRAAQDTARRLKAQAEALPEGAARETLEALAASAREAGRDLTVQALRLVRESAALGDRWRRLQTAPGIGPLVAAELVAHMPELGVVSSKAIAKLAGLAPFIRKSGAWTGKAVCSGGRPIPRQMLYLAVLSSLRARKGARPLYEHFIGRGKPPKLALTACMRRLLVTLNAMIRDGSDWKPASD